MPDNLSHHWVRHREVIYKGEHSFSMKCQYCGIAYEGGIHNDETCPEAPK